MVQLLGLVLISFVITGILIVPFIDLLFYLRRRFQRQEEQINTNEATPLHNKILSGVKVDTPQGGGLLLVSVLLLLANVLALFIPSFDTKTLLILDFTLISFGGMGAIDDFKRLLIKFKGKFSGLRLRYLLLLQIIFSLVIGWMLYTFIGLNNLYIPVIGNFIIGAWYIPFAAFTIVAFSNAYNISDGLDGLSTGLLMICLFAFLALTSINSVGSTDTLNITLAAFIGIWIGALIAFLYFNVWPARIFLGDAGAFGFGATLAVVGLLSGKIIGLGIIGGVYIVIVASSLFQILSKKFLKRKLMVVAPLHIYFRHIGWEEPKIVARFWLAGAIFAIFGLWLALLSG